MWNLLEIGPCTKCLVAGPGEDEDVAGVVGDEFSEACEQAIADGLVEGVVSLGTVDGESGNAIVLLVQDVVFAHRHSPRDARGPVYRSGRLAQEAAEQDMSPISSGRIEHELGA